MFNFGQYPTPSRNTYSHTTVEIKNAPTDEAVRLLKEMESAARDKIVKSVKLESNVVKGVLHTQLNVLNYTESYVALVDINGKRIESRTDLDPGLSEHEKQVKIYEELAKDIALAILPDAYKVMKAF